MCLQVLTSHTAIVGTNKKMKKRIKYFAVLLTMCLTIVAQSPIQLDKLVNKYWIFDTLIQACDNCDEFQLKTVSKDKVFGPTHRGGYIFWKDGTFKELDHNHKCGTYPPKDLLSGNWRIRSGSIYFYQNDSTDVLITGFHLYIIKLSDGFLKVKSIPND